MLILKRELTFNWEGGSGIVLINVFYKERLVHSLEGVDQYNKRKWHIKFFLPS
jgi:hypothetical protein